MINIFMYQISAAALGFDYDLEYVRLPKSPGILIIWFNIRDRLPNPFANQIHIFLQFKFIILLLKSRCFLVNGLLDANSDSMRVFENCLSRQSNYNT